MTWKTPASAHWALRVACQAQETETAPLCLTFKSRKVLPWPEGQRRYGVEFELTSRLEDGPQTTADSLQWEERTLLRRPTWRWRAFLRQGARPMPHAPRDSARPTGLLLSLIHSFIFGPSFPECSLIVRWVRKTKCTKQVPLCVWGQEKGGAGGKKRKKREAVIAPVTVRSACVPPFAGRGEQGSLSPTMSGGQLLRIHEFHEVERTIEGEVTIQCVTQNKYFQLVYLDESEFKRRITGHQKQLMMTIFQTYESYLSSFITNW